MLKKYTRDNILRDSVFGWNIQGKLLKIHVKCSKIPSDAVILVKSEEGEMIHQGRIDRNIMNVYPINRVTNLVEIPGPMVNVTVEKNGLKYLEEVPAPPILFEEEVKSDYFYSVGDVAIKVTGLQANEKIDRVKLVVEDNQFKA